MKRVTVIGCGAWATAMGHIMASNGHHVIVWCHRQEIADQINKKKQRELLKDITLHPKLKATTNMKEALLQSEAIVFCVASIYVEETLKKLKEVMEQAVPIMCLTKGIVSDNELFLSDIFKRELPGCKYAILSGPNLAYEVAQGKPAASVVASVHKDVAEWFQDVVSNKTFRAYTATDVKGVSLGGLLKNSIAIAAGCIDALELGANTKASLITRGLREIVRLGTHLGAQSETFYGLSGIGDLVATCESSKSRNYSVGYALGKGKVLDEILEEMHVVAEGVNTCKWVMGYCKNHGITMPITSIIYQVLYEQLDPREGIDHLMTRQLKDEIA